MAKLPIAYTDIVTPHRLSQEEVASFDETASNRPQLGRYGGGRFRMTLNLVEMNLRLRGGDIDELDAFLEAEQSFEVPCVNRVASSMTGAWTLAGQGDVGDTAVVLNTSGGAPHVGQLVRFQDDGKIYRVASYSAPVVTLTKPLRKVVPVNKAFLYSETDARANVFSGVLGAFINTDFGDTAPLVSRHVMCKFGPFQLVEDLT